MAFEHEASRLRKLACNPGVLVWWTRHGEDERNKDGITKVDVCNMLKRCRVTNVEDSGEEQTWRAEGTDIDGRSLVAIVVAYEDDAEIKVITTWIRR